MLSTSFLRASESAVIILALTVLSLNFAFKGFICFWQPEELSAPIGPQHGLWTVDTSKEVALYTGSWRHYKLHNAETWKLLSPGGGVIYLGPNQEPYTVAMMHELKCLDLLREQFTLPRAERDLSHARHCLNYLRQAVLCRGDLHVDPYRYAHPVNALPRYPVRRCKNFGAVYEKVAEIQQENQTADALMGE